MASRREAISSIAGGAARAEIVSKSLLHAGPVPTILAALFSRLAWQNQAHPETSRRVAPSRMGSLIKFKEEWRCNAAVAGIKV